MSEGTLQSTPSHPRSHNHGISLVEGSATELRSLHDTLQQHLRALTFITSIIELKLDATTLFEWQKHTQEKVDDVPPYQDLLISGLRHLNPLLARPRGTLVQPP